MFAVIATLGGLLGAGFVACSKRMALFRARRLAGAKRRFIEASHVERRVWGQISTIIQGGGIKKSEPTEEKGTTFVCRFCSGGPVRCPRRRRKRGLCRRLSHVSPAVDRVACLSATQGSGSPFKLVVSLLLWCCAVCQNPSDYGDQHRHDDRGVLPAPRRRRVSPGADGPGGMVGGRGGKPQAPRYAQLPPWRV